MPPGYTGQLTLAECQKGTDPGPTRKKLYSKSGWITAPLNHPRSGANLLPPLAHCGPDQRRNTMKKFVSLSVLVISIWVVTAQPRTTVYSTGGGPRDTASATLADDLENLCNCDRQFGPPAPVLDPNVLPIDTSLKDNKSCPSGVCQPCFDCYGWQLFLTLSWPSKPSGEPDPGAYFGKPVRWTKSDWRISPVSTSYSAAGRNRRRGPNSEKLPELSCTLQLLFIRI